MSRETRLLLLTLLVSVAVLFLLARFRFPARPISELATPQPLARLARTTTFDDLSGTLTELLRRAGETSVTLQVSAVGAGADGPGAGGVGGVGAGVSRFVPAMRVRDDLALAVLPGDARIEAIDGAAVSGGSSASPVLARDEVRGLVLLRVPARANSTVPLQPQGDALAFDQPGFVAIMESTPSGPTMRAEYVSRTSTRAHPAWDAAVTVLGLGGAQPRPGAMVFTLAGRFLGLVLPDDAETILVPGDALVARADRLARGESVLAANAGLAVQPLSSALALATKASNGVVIAAVENGGNNAGLRVGDVIAAIDNETIGSVADWERLLNRRAPGTTVRLQVVRRDGRIEIPLTLKWRDAPLAPGDNGAAAAAAAARRAGSAAGALGLTLRALPATATATAAAAAAAATASGSSGAGANGASLEVLRVTAGSAAARAGLQTGDRIVALPYAAAASAPPPTRAGASASASRSSADAPSGPAAGSALAAAPASAPLTVARVEAAYKALASRDAMLLGINRGGQPLVVAVEKP
jgi:S1-C subfamily serine protease